jgi:hypothetical protein
LAESPLGFDALPAESGETTREKRRANIKSPTLKPAAGGEMAAGGRLQAAGSETNPANSQQPTASSPVGYSLCAS